MSTVHRAPQRSNLGGPSGGFPGLATRSVLARCRENSTPPMGPSAGGSAEASASRSMPSAQGIGVRRAGCGAGLQDVEVNAVRRAALPAASALFVVESGAVAGRWAEVSRRLGESRRYRTASAHAWQLG